MTSLFTASTRVSSKNKQLSTTSQANVDVTRSRYEAETANPGHMTHCTAVFQTIGVASYGALGHVPASSISNNLFFSVHSGTARSLGGWVGGLVATSLRSTPEAESRQVHKAIGLLMSSQLEFVDIYQLLFHT